MRMWAASATFLLAIGVVLSGFSVPVHAVNAPPKFTGDERYASIVVDADTGRVLSAVNADHTLHPASLTKIMTLYMTFDALKQGKLTLKQILPVSAHAASMTPTELGLKAGEKITVEQAILGLVTKSANDAAVVLAEAIGGTEADFGKAMTERAFSIGLVQSNFANASGLPDTNQLSSARDMAVLALAMLRDHPDEYRYFSTPQFTYRGRVNFNHNRLLALYKGTDGVKTGYTHDSGYNLVASAQRDGRRIIGVVFGGSTGHGRDAHMVSLLDDGFRALATPNTPPSTQLATIKDFDLEGVLPVKPVAPEKKVAVAALVEPPAKAEKPAAKTQKAAAPTPKASPVLKSQAGLLRHVASR